MTVLLAIDPTIDEKEKSNLSLPKIEIIINDHKRVSNTTPYFKAKLLLALGDEDNILRSFLPFAKQKRNDFWVWELMVEIFPNDEETQFACYCKALSPENTPKTFLVKNQDRHLQEMLVDKQMYDEAKKLRFSK